MGRRRQDTALASRSSTASLVKDCHSEEAAIFAARKESFFFSDSDFCFLLSDF